MIKAVVLVCSLGMVLCAPSDPYGKPDPYKEEKMPHSFNYGVNDDYAGLNFGHNENSDGNNVVGSYTVQLPDGRKQTVEYEADHYKGYVAKVSYYGEAQYPHEYGPAITFKPQTYHPQPSYQPEPAGYQ